MLSNCAKGKVKIVGTMTGLGRTSSGFIGLYYVLRDCMGLRSSVMCYPSHETPINSTLTQAEVSDSRHVSSDRSIAENGFERLFGF